MRRLFRRLDENEKLCKTSRHHAGACGAVLFCGCRKVRQAAAITIIGGADGPTSIWGSGSPGKIENLKVAVTIRNLGSERGIADEKVVALSDAESLLFSRAFRNVRSLGEPKTLRQQVDDEEGTVLKLLPTYIIEMTDGEETITLQANDLYYAKAGTSLYWKWNDGVQSVLKSLDNRTR